MFVRPTVYRIGPDMANPDSGYPIGLQQQDILQKSRGVQTVAYTFLSVEFKSVTTHNTMRDNSVNSLL